MYLHRDDQFLYDAAPQQAAFFGLHCDVLPPIDRYYDLAETLSFGEYEISVHHTPGHCPGGVCLAVGASGAPKHDLFVGDTLFAGSIGRTDLPGGDYATLMRSITDVLFAVRRRRESPFGPWSRDDHRPGAPHESGSLIRWKSGFAGSTLSHQNQIDPSAQTAMSPSLSDGRLHALVR